MSLRPGKLLLLLLIPAVLYGALKGVMYYNAKRSVDDIVATAADHADVRYADISTDVRGAVTVSGIAVQPLGSDEVVTIDSVRLASDDPLLFIRGFQWGDDQQTPPNALSFHVSGLSVPLATAFPDQPVAPAADGAGLCSDGLSIDPQLLQRIGLSAMNMDLDGSYRIDETNRTLDLGMNVDLRDIQSIRLSATLNDVDTQSLAQGVAPSFSLGRFDIAVRVSPSFGRQALKACAIGTDQSVQAWSAVLAEQALQQFSASGLTLGDGLSKAVHDFYRDWGEFRIVAAPAKPIGLLSLVAMRPEQLVPALGLRLSLNDQPINDTAFTWQQPDAAGLAALFGTEEEVVEGKTVDGRPRRIIVRRQYEPVQVADIASYVDHQVKIKPRGLPMREGLLKRIRNGEAEVEQTLHGGKYTAYVALAQIQSLQVLIQREVPPRK
jgi:hypothetical protein